jgi:hypothetical protein
MAVWRGAAVRLWIYDDHVTVKGLVRNTQYIDTTEALEAHLLGIVGGKQPGLDPVDLPIYMRELIRWRKDPDAPRYV